MFILFVGENNIYVIIIYHILLIILIVIFYLLLLFLIYFQTFGDGIDFYFVQKQHAMRFIDFLTSKIPAKSKYARKLVSADHKSNIGKFKHNFIVEIIPICKV